GRVWSSCRRRFPSFVPFLVLPLAPAPEIYPLSLHDALPISIRYRAMRNFVLACSVTATQVVMRGTNSFGYRAIAANQDSLLLFVDRKSTRLNSSHVKISYAVLCLKKKKNQEHTAHEQN